MIHNVVILYTAVYHNIQLYTVILCRTLQICFKYD
jgi:hypothetical protein